MKNNSVKWTPEQLAAISLKDRTLLVSAAAGSGKTAVLTERIIKKLTDKDSPADISRFLIVTFTKAAASELKTRISKAISSAISADPSNKHLSRQLLLLGSAKICTIHSFCLDVIKKNLQALDLPKGISVSNDAEMLLHSREIMEEIIDEAFSGIFEESLEIPNFEAFMDIFARGGSDSDVADTFLKIYNRLMSYPEGTEFLREWAEILKNDAENSFFASKHGKIITENLSEQAEYLLIRYNLIFNEIRDNDEIAFSKYAPILSDEISLLSSLHGCLSTFRADLAKKHVASYESRNLPVLTPKGYKSAYTPSVQEIRKNLKVLINDTLIPLLNADQEEIGKQTLMTAEAVDALYRLLTAFDLRFRREKLKLLKVDYNDLERYTYALLIKDGKPTEIAREVSESYDEIYIDEYQDTNFVQDMIFTAIARDDNRFMVGDIKQSIYGFRGAAPENFARYRDSYELYDENKNPSDTKPTTVFLANNVRCDNSSVDFCNRIFSRLFTNNSGRIKYYPHDDLVCSKLGGKENTVPAKIILAKSPSKDEEGITEADIIAKEISHLLKHEKKKDGSSIKPSDIAILVRAKDSSVEIEEKLNALGIGTSNNVATEFFENPEILLMMALLNTIDNPQRDIFLAGTLKSPIFKFTLDELVKVRASSKSRTLYGALIEYTEKTGFEKGKYFLEKLSYFRQITTGTRIDRLIWKLYQECDMFRIVANNHSPDETPLSARENLMLLYKYARGFENNSFKGLNAFISYVDDIIAKKTQLPENNSGSESAETVKLMTIHHSKGLEFPVVFLASTHKNIRPKNSNAFPVLLDKHAGVSVDLPDPLKISNIHTLHKTALSIKINENEYEEAMRVLYVALTRARERLYVTGNFKEPEKEIEKAHANADNLCKFVIMRNTSFMQLILTTLFDSGEGDYEYSVVDEIEQGEKVDTSKREIVDGEEIFKAIRENLSFTYPYIHARNVPAKLSVSDLSPDALDVTEDEDEEKLRERLDETVPAFMLESKKVTGADKGTANHVFMQFCDFASVEANGVENEIIRLLDRHFIPMATAELIDRKKVAEFFESDLYKRIIKSSVSIKREFRFNVQLPASEFTQRTELKSILDGEKLFVQGIIDCFTQNTDGTYTLIDYKTDRIPPELLENTEEAEKMIANRHRTQLSYYKRALELLSKKKVSRVYIYSFGLGHEIDVTDYC